MNANSLISRQTLASNDCFSIVMQFLMNKNQAFNLPLRRLNRNANKHFSKDWALTQFSRAKKKIIINHNCDHYQIARSLPKLSVNHDLKIHFNINIKNWENKAYKKEEDASPKNAFKTLAYFLARFQLHRFSLNYQLISSQFDLDIA